MELVRNPRFLTKDDKGYKLRRRVPDGIEELVGKTAWVKDWVGLHIKKLVNKRIPSQFGRPLRSRSMSACVVWLHLNL